MNSVYGLREFGRVFCFEQSLIGPAGFNNFGESDNKILFHILAEAVFIPDTTLSISTQLFEHSVQIPTSLGKAHCSQRCGIAHAHFIVMFNTKISDINKPYHYSISQLLHLVMALCPY
ncbi:hypothetical protein VFPPC_16224 [Pochonia chlamydosporia 170]|uniref:Uncharacterized protein n=1 Tax=Pochonia chlamydosporia 170 TaxID=1380566 RepID=A0A179FGY9_METCM|nr:hypothetical protein VFPPC_16224 [Pochonia chlamydosporia 170]OAQ64521.1 hypothetical protein VFPPC_16224 [Pochonia chlamydosporia 170]